MITLETLTVRVRGLEPAQVEAWIEQELLRPEGRPGDWRFREIDVERLRLIQELRRDLALQEEALPVVLHLLDQLYDTRRRLRRLCEVVEQVAPEDLRESLLRTLRRPHDP
jgi:chaperone modulatory protein CbpM